MLHKKVESLISDTMTRHSMTVTPVFKQWGGLQAFRQGRIAPGMEMAAVRGIRRAGDLSFKDDALSLPLQRRIGNGDG